MGFHLSRHLIVFSALLLLLVYFTAAEESTTSANSEEEDDSSSEETVEDSNESRRKRSIETSTASKGSGGDAANSARAGIPGLPDPATILKIAQILQTVGEKVIPILVEGNPEEFISSLPDRFNRDFQFLKMFKTEIETFTAGLRN